MLLSIRLYDSITKLTASFEAKNTKTKIDIVRHNFTRIIVDKKKTGFHTQINTLQNTNKLNIQM